MKKTNAKITYELPLKPSERLDLSRHALKVIPRDKKYEKYRRVDLSHNNIQTLSNIEQFDSLEELSLSANKIVDWHQLTRIRNPFLLKKLFVKNNVLEKQPNYRFKILQHFRSLRVIDELELPVDSLPVLLYLQECIEGNLIDWVDSLVELDTILDHQTEDKQSKPQIIQKLVIVFGELTEHYEQGNFQNKSLIQKGLFIEQILKQTGKLIKSRNRSKEQLTAIQFSFFCQLLIEISQHTPFFMEYLLNQIELSNESEEELLKQSAEISSHILYLEFKALNQIRDQDEKYQRMSSFQTDTNTHRQQTRFPYLGLEKYFVDALLKIMTEVLRGAISKITHLLKISDPVFTNFDSVIQHKESRKQYVQNSKQINESKIMMHHQQTYRTNKLQEYSQQQEESIFLQEKHLQLSTAPDYKPQISSVPTALAVALLNVIEQYQIKYAFSRIKKNNKKSYNKLRKFTTCITIKETIHKQRAFQTIKNHSDSQIRMQNDYILIKHKAKAFYAWRKLIQLKKHSLKLLSKIIKRKTKVQNTMTHFAFVRWKILNSRTLRYIEHIKSPIYQPPRQMTQREIQRQYEKFHKKHLKRLSSYRGPIKTMLTYR